MNIGELFGELGNELRQNAALAGVMVAALVGLNIAIDYLTSSGSTAASGMSGMFAELYLTRALLIRRGIIQQASKVHFFRFWGMSILSTLGIVLGFLLLILPGLYVAARWFVAAPVLVGEEKTAGEALRESWD